MEAVLQCASQLPQMDVTTGTRDCRWRGLGSHDQHAHRPEPVPRRERGGPGRPEAPLAVGPEHDPPPARQRARRHPRRPPRDPGPARPALAGHGGDEAEVLRQREVKSAHRLPAGGTRPGPGALAHPADRPMAGARTATAPARAAPAVAVPALRPGHGLAPTRSARRRPGSSKPTSPTRPCWSSAGKIVRTTRAAWNRAMETVPGWPQQRLAPVPPKRTPYWLREDQLPASLRERDHGLPRQPGPARSLPGTEPQGPGAGHRRPAPHRLHHPGLGPGRLRRPGRAADLAGGAGAARPPRAGPALPLRPGR